ncbi:MAG: mechanosensitive ion channel [Candidatus Saccharimonadales bacterium]
MHDLLQNILSISNNSFIKILLVVLLALVAQIIVKTFVRYILRIPLTRSDAAPSHKRDREKRVKTLTGVATAAAVLGIWFIAFILIMGILNIPIAPLLTSAGLIGAALAFGMQSLIRDFISGIFIIAENQYRVDDYIQLEKVSGRVEAITVRTTVLRSEDGTLHHVPNGSIGITTNLSMGAFSARETVELDSAETIKSFEKALVKIASDIEKDEELSSIIKDGPRLVSITKATAKSTTVLIEFKTTPAKREKAQKSIWQALKESGISLA